MAVTLSTVGKVVAGAVSAFLLVSSAQAAVLDFTTATNDGTTLTTPEATVTAFSGTTLSVGDFIANAVCPLGGFGCNGGMTLVFNFDVNNVAFDFGFGDPGDTATITGFDSLANQVGQIVLNLTSGTSSQSLAAFGTLRSIVFDNTLATGAGYAYGNITFDSAATPLPAALPLFATGLGALGLLGWRRKKKAAAALAA